MSSCGRAATVRLLRWLVVLAQVGLDGVRTAAPVGHF